MKKVAMIGVGKLGQDCAEVMAEHYDVVGYDVAPRYPSNFKMKDSIQEAVEDRDIIFVAAPTSHDPIYGGETPTSHLPNKDFDYSIVTGILEEVNKHVSQKQLVVLISTVLPGTVRAQLRPCITNARFIYNPYLIAMGTVKWDMVNPEMVIIGTEDGSITGDAKELIDFYKVFMENDPRYEVGTWDEAESIKIFYNTFISTKLALVNMIQDVAQVNGNINVDIVTGALARSNYRITGPAYMKAGMGDAGACHPRDNIALRYLAERLDLGYDLFDAIMKAREVQAERLANTCLMYGNTVCIIGKAYKPGVAYTNGSYSLLVGHYIEKNGGKVAYYDLNTGEKNIPLDTYKVYLIGYWEQWVERLFELHNIRPDGLVIDPWRHLTAEMYPGTIIHYGNTRKDKKAQELEQQHLKTYTANLWPETKFQKDIYYVAANPTLIHKHDYFLIEDINSAISEGKKKVIFYNTSEPMAKAEFAKIHNLLPKLKVPVDKVYYLTATHNAQETYDKICEELKITDKIHVVSLAAMQRQLQLDANRIEKPEFVVEPKQKKFLCFNKVPRLHRVALIGKLLQRNLLDTGFCSTYVAEDEFSYHLGQALDALVKIEPEIVNVIKNKKDIFPLVIDPHQPGRHNPIDLLQEDVQFYQNSYYSLVTETLFYRDTIDPIEVKSPYYTSVTFTEKTFKPIVMRHPFIIVGVPGLLKTLREMGYKTFAPFIDESYDNEQDDGARLEMVVREVERLNSFTESQWIDWLKKVEPIVEHNYNVFFKTRNFRISRDVEI